MSSCEDTCQNVVNGVVGFTRVLLSLCGVVSGGVWWLKV